MEETQAQTATASGTVEKVIPQDVAAAVETGIQPAEFETIESGGTSGGKEKKIDLLLDINLPVAIELGRCNMLIKDIIDLQKGSIVELDKSAGEPVDILINGKKMAEGEVVVIDQHFAVRITGLVKSPDTIATRE